MKKEEINKFLSTIDLNKIIKEATMSAPNGVDVDDGPSTWYSNSKIYKNKSKENAERIGYTIINYIIDENEWNLNKEIHPPKIQVTYFPAGVAGKVTVVNYKDLKGKKATNAWLKDIKRTAAILGFEFVNWKDSEDDIKSAEKLSLKTNKDDNDNTIKESILNKEWWKGLLK